MTTSTESTAIGPVAVWYFDVISPFAWLQLPAVLRLRERISITPCPVLLGAVLHHHGQLGPAEIASKREFTYRHVVWQARRAGSTLTFPPTHPFNPTSALRLIIAADTSWPAIEAVFAHLWRDGKAGDTAESLADVGHALGITDVSAATTTETVKQALRQNTEQAIAAGVFGVPTLALDGQLFWGNDATAMVHDAIDRPGFFDQADYVQLRDLPVGISRRR